MTILLHSLHQPPYQIPPRQSLLYFGGVVAPEPDGAVAPPTETKMYIHLKPLPRSISSGSRVHFYFPPGTRLADDYTGITCAFRTSQKPNRPYFCTDTIVSTKRRGMGVSYLSCTAPMDIEATEDSDVLVECGPFFPPSPMYDPASETMGRIYVNNGEPIEVIYGYEAADQAEKFPPYVVFQ